MGHTYYSEEIEKNNQQRLEYFDKQFESLSGRLANAQGISLSKYLSDVRDVKSFENKLTEAFSIDGSLANYVEGMSQQDFQAFFDRPLIQSIVSANLADEPEKIEEEIITEVPVKVEQEGKETRAFFKASLTDKKTGKKKRTIGYEDEVKVKGKKIKVLRDSKGRFVKRT